MVRGDHAAAGWWKVEEGALSGMRNAAHSSQLTGPVDASECGRGCECGCARRRRRREVRRAGDNAAAAATGVGEHVN